MIYQVEKPSQAKASNQEKTVLKFYTMAEVEKVTRENDTGEPGR